MLHLAQNCNFNFSWTFEFFRVLLEKELETVGIRLNKRKPNIYFKVFLLHDNMLAWY